VKGFLRLILRNVSQDRKAIIDSTYFEELNGACGGLRGLRMLVGFRIGSMNIKVRSCEFLESWPNVHGADGAVPSNKYALVLR